MPLALDLVRAHLTHVELKGINLAGTPAGPGYVKIAECVGLSRQVADGGVMSRSFLVSDFGLAGAQLGSPVGRQLFHQSLFGMADVGVGFFVGKPLGGEQP